MEIFKDAGAYQVLKYDVTNIYEAFNRAKSRAAEKLLEAAMEGIVDEIINNLTEEAAEKITELSLKFEDLDPTEVVDFFVWKSSAQVESAKDFILRMGLEGCIDEDVVSQVRVYPGDFYIEIIDKEGLGVVHSLTLENASWIEPEITLDAMELELFKYAQGEGG